MPAPILITPPALPVTLAEAKIHLRVDHSDDDDLISTLIQAATAHFDGWQGVLGRALEPQTWELALDRFPAREIQLPLGPAASVASVKYDDVDGVEQTVNSADYVLDARPVEAWIVPVDTFAWPDTMDRVNAVRIQWVAGTGCPTPIRQAIMLLVGHWYQNREAVAESTAELPLGVKTLAAPWRRVGI